MIASHTQEKNEPLSITHDSTSMGMFIHRFSLIFHFHQWCRSTPIASSNPLSLQTDSPVEKLNLTNKRPPANLAYTAQSYLLAWRKVETTSTELLQMSDMHVQSHSLSNGAVWTSSSINNLDCCRAVESQHRSQRKLPTQLLARTVPGALAFPWITVP